MILSELKIGLCFGTDTGNTEEIAYRIQAELLKHGASTDTFNVTEASSTLYEVYDFIIFGIPTWDFGGIQQDWEEVGDEFKEVDLNGKITALYGLGDQFGYGDYFLDAMGWLHERLLATGASIIGAWSTQGYDFTASLAANEDKTQFCGLAVDEDQQFDLTDARITTWVNQLAEEIGQLQDKQSA